MNKPDWDTYFITIALLVAQRSPDPSTKHGTVLINERNHIIGVGFNGGLPSVPDKDIPFQDREAKLDYVSHSEVNALDSSKEKPYKAYITGFPCIDCFKRLAYNGVTEIIYGPIQSNSVNKDKLDMVYHLNSLLLPHKQIKIRQFECNSNIFQLLYQTADYLSYKLSNYVN